MLIAALINVVMDLMNVLFAFLPDPPGANEFLGDPELLASSTVFGAGPTHATPLSVLFATLGSMNNYFPIDVVFSLWALGLIVNAAIFGIAVVRWGLRLIPAINLD